MQSIRKTQLFLFLLGLSAILAALAAPIFASAATPHLENIELSRLANDTAVIRWEPALTVSK